MLFLHGDRFDSFISERPILTRLADNFYRTVQMVDGSFYLARLLKGGSKTFMRSAERIREQAKSYAQKKGMDVVVCSHIHFCEEDRSGSVEYHNTGCWTESPCSYLIVFNGQIRSERKI
jgi:UDP-2,3-diacylglucosamine pyrophosphatase LpxH